MSKGEISGGSLREDGVTRCEPSKMEPLLCMELKMVPVRKERMWYLKRWVWLPKVPYRIQTCTEGGGRKKRPGVNLEELLASVPTVAGS